MYRLIACSIAHTRTCSATRSQQDRHFSQKRHRGKQVDKTTLTAVAQLGFGTCIGIRALPDYVCRLARAVHLQRPTDSLSPPLWCRKSMKRAPASAPFPSAAAVAGAAATPAACAAACAAAAAGDAAAARTLTAPAAAGRLGVPFALRLASRPFRRCCRVTLQSRCRRRAPAAA